MKQEKETPGTRQSTGGEEETRASHPNIIPPRIADLSQPGERERLLDEALAFLTDWCRDGPWVLTSIVQDGGTTTETFHATDTSIAQMRTWIGARLDKQSIYFTVNRTYGDVESKPNKGAIAAIRAVHVDVDPRPGEDVGAERARAVRKLREYDPPPTVIIDSGGGMQGFWLLDGEADVGGSAELARLFWRRADEAKRGKLDPDERAAVEAHEARLRDVVELRNLRPDVSLQADACHNADRIMRLVGTVNVPNKKKRGRGSVPTVASVVEADWSRRYPLDAFPPADVKPATSASDALVSISSDRPDVDLEALPISTRCRAIIVNGGDPDDSGRNESRSEWLWGVVCEMVRAGVADDDIATVILDRGYAISAHVYDQPRPEQYAQRQIQRARDEAIHPKLRELNDLHAVLSNQDGKCRVMEFVEMPTGVKGKTRLVPSLQSFEDVRNRYLNQRVAVGQDKDGKDIYMALGKWWLENPLRRQFHSLTFQPRAGEVVGDGAMRRLNLWQGFAVRPEPGEWTLMRAHIRDVLARGDDGLAAYIERWMAWTLQNPDEPAEVALVFRGEPGTGKGVFGRAMAQLFGQHGLHTGGSELITGRFNLHFRDCLVSKFADHQPLFRQSQIYARQGVKIERSTLASWVGKAAYELVPVYDALLRHLKTSTKLFMDETPAPVLDPGRGKVKKG